jgi:hypothetical protein
MRPSASDRLVLAAFALLAVGSLGLKAAAGPPRDGLMDVSDESFEQILSTHLQARHFAVSVQRFQHRSAMIVGVREGCRVSARDAREGVAHEVLFARDAADLGPVRYFYSGRSYDDPPTFAMRLGRLETEAVNRLGLSAREPVPVAFAATAACGGDNFGLSDVRI